MYGYLLSGPEGDIGPSDGHRASAAVGGVSTNLVIEASGRSVVITESQGAVDVDSEALDVRVVDSVDGDTLADVGNVGGESSTALDAVETAAGVNTQDEVWASVAVESLLDGDAAAAQGVDGESAGKLVNTTSVIVGITALSTEMAVGAAGAAGASVGACRNGESASTDAAACASLGLEAWVRCDPVAALDGSSSKGDRDGRKAGEKALDKHFDE